MKAPKNPPHIIVITLYVVAFLQMVKQRPISDDYVDVQISKSTAQLCLRTVVLVIFWNKSIVKVWVHKLKLRRVLKLRNVRKSNKLLKSAILRIFDFRNILADHPPLLNSSKNRNYPHH